jgi:hypothetical protein
MPRELLPGGKCTQTPPSGGRHITPMFVFISPVNSHDKPVSAAVAANSIIGILGQTRTVSDRSGGLGGAPSGPSATPSGPSGVPSGPSATPSGPSGVPSGPSATPSGPSGAPSGPSATPSGPSGAPSGPSTTPSGPSGAPSGPSATPSVQKDPLGELVSVNLELVGLRGQPVLLSWSIFQEDGHTNLFGTWLRDFVAYRLEATTNDDTATLEMWIPLPKLPGPYFIHLSLTTDGAGLTSVNSAIFD